MSRRTEYRLSKTEALFIKLFMLAYLILLFGVGGWLITEIMQNFLECKG